jgi:phospholipid/cholesterol/gamma-HCH transport system substrate-binding protein
MEKSRHDTWIGLALVIAAVVAVLACLNGAGLIQLTGRQSYPVSAHFGNIGSLKAHAAVRSAGVEVGRIENIKYDNLHRDAAVRINLYRPYIFPKDSSLKILTTGLVGDLYLGLEAGAAEENLQAGDIISSTQSAIGLESLLKQFLNSGRPNTAKDDKHP